MNFKIFLEANRVVTVYHVTYLKNVDDIGNSSLRARGGFSAWQKYHLQQHSQKGTFYCTTSQCVRYWINELAEQSYALSDEPAQEMFIPIILRFNLNQNKGEIDMLGNAETKGNFYTTREIPNVGLEMWNGRQWTDDISSDSVYIDSFVDYEGYNDEQEILDTRNGYPLPPELET